MTILKSIDYECPRCGYKTEKKTNMKTHYARKNVCPPNINKLELTDFIKNEVLVNRIYIPPTIVKREDDVPGRLSNARIIDNSTDNSTHNVYILHTLIQQNNMIENYINKMNVLDKVSHILQHQGVKQICYGDRVESLFQKNVDKMMDNNKLGPTYDTNDLYECVNQTTRIDKIVNNFNIKYDKDTANIHIYHNDEWEIYLLEKGIDKMIELLQLNYFTDYEKYLLRESYNPVKNDRTNKKEHLAIYYKFLAAFGLKPYVIGCTDFFILGFRLSDEKDSIIYHDAISIYNHEKANLTKTNLNQIRSDVTNIIKRNTIQNIKEINIVAMNLMKMTKEFRDTLLRQIMYDNSYNSEATSITQNLESSTATLSENLELNATVENGSIS